MTSRRAHLPPLRLCVHGFAILTCLATFVLIASGGLVTSKGVGMAVPDWPTTFGYNMFLFPMSRWVGGIFYEHTHRLIASTVGFLTLILAIGVLASDPRRWVKVLAGCIFAAVVVQGVLGGLRVTLINDKIGIFHGLLAQSFFVALAILAMVTGPSFSSGAWLGAPGAWRLRKITLLLAICVFAQLGAGAMMRHAHAGLSIPDFPLAYGSILPPADAATIEAINASRAASGQMPTSAFLIWLQMGHRAMAVVILLLAGACAWKAFREPGVPRGLRVAFACLPALVCLQALLGGWTIWSDKAADIATAHMALGALLLLASGMLAFRCWCAGNKPRAGFSAPITSFHEAGNRSAAISD